jgi:hypothetical protein
MGNFAAPPTTPSFRASISGAAAPESTVEKPVFCLRESQAEGCPDVSRSIKDLYNPTWLKADC